MAISGMVLYQRADGTAGSCIVNGLRGAVDETAAYYQGIGYQIVRRELSELCDTCDGRGSVRKGRSQWATKTCPTCKGDPVRVVESW